MLKRKKSGGDGLVSKLIRDAGIQVKLNAEQRELDTDRPVIDVEVPWPEDVPYRPRIFNILQYIEEPWGLDTKLYPAQRFIVKLYYHLPLDDKDKTIELYDMFGEKLQYRFTETEYLRYLYDEGRCNIKEQDHERHTLVLAIGRRAGKCLSADSLVLTDRGLFRIDELGAAAEEAFSPFETTVAQERGRRAQSVAFYNGGVKPTLAVKSWSGYSIRGTANHRVKVMTSEGVVDWRFLDEIHPGDYVAIHRGTNLWANEPLDIRAYHNNDGRKDVELPETLGENLGCLLGYLVGDGSWTNETSTSLTVEHPETWDRVEQLLETLFGRTRRQMDLRTENTGRLEFVGVCVRRFLHALGFDMDTARDAKMVPWAILRSPKPVVAAFLRGVFETDGCAEDEGRSITFSSASFRLAHEIQILLLNFGILCSVRPKWSNLTQKHYANLLVKGHRSRQLFVEQIGFESNKKRLPTENYLKTSASDGKSNTDSVPFQLRHLRALLESTPRNYGGNGSCGWSRSKLRAVLGNSCKPGSGEDLTCSRMRRAVGLAKELNAGQKEVAHFEDLLALDYFFDKVETVEHSEDQVYDLTVPDGESFVANGFTNHNTTLSGIFASYEIYRLLNLGNPQAYYGLPNGNRIQLTSVATDKEQAGLLFQEVTNHLAKCSYFKPYIANNTLSHVQFRTPYDLETFGDHAHRANGKFVSLNGKATLRITFKSCVAKGLRGHGNVVIILDEMAHFQDKGQSSAKDIWDSITPSTAAFSPKKRDANGQLMPIKKPDGTPYPVESRIVCISSPLNKTGKFHDLFHLAMTAGPGSHEILAIQAPTWEVNPTLPSTYYKEKYHEDPAVFMTEHGAQFSDRLRGWIEREQDLLACVDPELRPQRVGIPRYPHQMGIDVGLVNDATSVVITTELNGLVEMVYHEVWQAGVDWRLSNPHLGAEYVTDYSRGLGTVDRLEFDEIGEWIFRLTKRFHITAGIFDRWNGIPLEQSLLKKGLSQFRSEPFPRELTSRIYQNAKMLMFDKRLHLYDHPVPEGKKHSPAIAELLTLQAQQMSNNIVLVAAPQGPGYHDDFSDAFVRAVWLTSERMREMKYVYGAHLDRGPVSASRMTPLRYQTMRSRAHGYLGDRPHIGRPVRR